ncbi:2-C-methyl-D-erythritol 4-phosphate cytidylyltransferase [Lachnospiraceae bacterium 62-35]
MNVGVILAAGTGTRVGAGIPKQFIKVQGKPILAYTLEIFQKNKNIDAIEVVCHKD